MFLITISKISRWGQQGNMSKLLDTLQDDNDENRKAAALTLGKIGDLSILEYLIRASKSETDVFVKMDIESSIRMIRSKNFPQGTTVFKEVETKRILQPSLNFSIK